MHEDWPGLAAGLSAPLKELRTGAPDVMKGFSAIARAALEPKARLGAKPQPMSVWMRHQQPLINQVTRRLLGFAQHDEAPEVNPFKVSPFKKEKEKAA